MMARLHASTTRFYFNRPTGRARDQGRQRAFVFQGYRLQAICENGRLAPEIAFVPLHSEEGCLRAGPPAILAKVAQTSAATAGRKAAPIEKPVTTLKRPTTAVEIARTIGLLRQAAHVATSAAIVGTAIIPATSPSAGCRPPLIRGAWAINAPPARQPSTATPERAAARRFDAPLPAGR